MFWCTSLYSPSSRAPKHMKLDGMRWFRNHSPHLLKWDNVFMIAPLCCVSLPFDPSSLRQPQMLDIQIWLHLFLFPLQQMGTSDRLTIRCYYFPFFQQTAHHTLHVNLVLIEEVTTIVIKLWRRAGIQIDRFWIRSVERVVFEKLLRFETNRSSLGHPPSVMPSLVISGCQSCNC